MTTTMTRRALVCSWMGAGVLVALAGCASDGPAEARGLDERPARAYAEPEAWFSGDRPVSQPLVLRARGQEQPTRLLGKQKLSSSWDGAPGAGVVPGGVGELLRVQYAANGASAEEVIRVLAGDFLERSWVLDPSIANASQQVTMSIDEEMTRADVRDLLGGLASMYGWVLEDRGDVLYFRSKGSGSGSGGGGVLGRLDSSPLLRAESAVETDTPAVRVKRLRHMSAAEAAEAVRQLLSPGAAVIASGRTVLLVDSVRQTNRVSRVLDALDVPAFEGVEIHTYRLSHRSNDDAASFLSSVASSWHESGGAAGISFLAVPGTSDLMVIARDPTLLTTARDLIETIDRPAGGTAEGAFLYRIQHYEPQALVRMVREFFGEGVEVSSGIGAGAAQRPGTPRTQRKMRLVLDAEEDLLLVRATPEEYADLLTLLAAIDRPRQQVMLNAMIAEVRLTDQLQYGIEYFINIYNDNNTILDFIGDPLFNPPGTGVLTLTNTNFFVMLNALMAESDLNVLSQPRVVVMDRGAVEFQVGGEVPVVRGDLNSEAGTSESTQIRRDIEYRDTGIQLTIRPKINESGTVTLEIDQEISEVGAQSELGPEFNTRRLSTQVSVPHGRTILLAGIIQEETTLLNSKIPFLGELPVIGAVFQSQSESQERRELFLAITPTIVSDPGQAQGTLGEFLEAAEAMRAAMHGNDERLQRGVLNTEELGTELGGHGDVRDTPGAGGRPGPPEGGSPDGSRGGRDGGLDDGEEPTIELDFLMEPAVFIAPARSVRGAAPTRSFGFWTFGASLTGDAPRDDRDADGSGEPSDDEGGD